MLLTLVTGARAQQGREQWKPIEPSTPGVRFAYIDVYVDPGSRPLAAYQLDLKATRAAGSVKIVGIEGGESAAYKQPPYYDPKAMQRDRVILAAYSTAPPSDLPTARTRVARIHIEITDDKRPAFACTLTSAADFSGERIQGEVDIKQQGDGK